MMKIIFISCLTIAITFSQTINFPIRNQTALSGNLWASKVLNYSRVDRENDVFNQILNFGNIPNFLRTPTKISFSKQIGGNNYTVDFFTLPDYFAIGHDSDYFLIPMTPILAQKIANEFGLTLPTRKLVNEIYQNSKLKLPPQPIPPSAAMTTMPVFKQHNDSVWSLRKNNLVNFPLGTLVGGTKKDIVISNNIYNNLKPNVPKPVVIYGWHQLSGVAIQPLYNGHEETYADYSHGARFILDSVLINGEKKNLKTILKDSQLAELFSDEGVIQKPYYTTPTNLSKEKIGKNNFNFENFPNPFNPSTMFVYQLPQKTFVSFKVFDSIGREIATLVNEEKSIGSHKILWNASGLSSGAYFCSLNFGGEVFNKLVCKLK